MKYDRYNFEIYDYEVYYGIDTWKNWLIFLGKIYALDFLAALRLFLRKVVSGGGNNTYDIIFLGYFSKLLLLI